MEDLGSWLWCFWGAVVVLLGSRTSRALWITSDVRAAGCVVFGEHWERRVRLGPAGLRLARQSTGGGCGVFGDGAPAVVGRLAAPGHNRLCIVRRVEPTDPQAPEDEPLQLDLFGGAGRVEVRPLVEVPRHLVAVDQALPRAFRKANAVVHMVSLDGAYTLVQRRGFNVLNGLAQAKLESLAPSLLQDLLDEKMALTFSAPMADVMRLVDWGNSHNVATLYGSLAGLLNLPVRVDYLDEHGGAWKAETRLLGDIARSEDGRMLEWAWSPRMFGLMFNPAHSFTPIDFDVSRQFSSRYSMALFENTYRYRNFRQRGGAPATPWRPVHDWRLLVAGPRLYRQTNEFMRSCLRPAVAEVNETLTSPVSLEMQVQRGKPANRIESIRFVIHPKTQRPLAMEMPLGLRPDLVAHLKRLGLAEDKIVTLTQQHDQALLLERVAFTDRAHARKPLLNPAGFFLKALDELYEDEVTRQEKVTAQRLAVAEVLDTEALEKQRQSRWAAYRLDEARRWFETANGEDEQRALLDAFRAQAGPLVLRGLAKNGLRNKMASVAFYGWVAKQPGVLRTPEALSLEAFCREFGD